MKDWWQNLKARALLSIFPDVSIQKQGLCIPVAFILATWGPHSTVYSVSCMADITIYHHCFCRHLKENTKITDLLRRDFSEWPLSSLTTDWTRVKVPYLSFSRCMHVFLKSIHNNINQSFYIPQNCCTCPCMAGHVWKVGLKSLVQL